MDSILNLLKTLELDSTIFIQFGIFLLAYLPIKLLVFKPYFEAYKERLRRTEGNQQDSESFLKEANELKEKLEVRTREVNAEYKTIYDTGRNAALKEQEGILSTARSKAKTEMDSARENIAQQFESAKKQIQSDVADMGEIIVGKMMQ
tara:strand:+ start:138738 stop:139181 length:444 start_codon:yes stop_codon:yes gene_type:complete